MELFIGWLGHLSGDPVEVAIRGVILGFATVSALKILGFRRWYLLPFALLEIRPSKGAKVIALATIGFFIFNGASALVATEKNPTIVLVWAITSLLGALAGAYISRKKWDM